MDAATKDRLIARISWGYVKATVSTRDEGLISILLRPPTPKEQAQAAMVYSTERERAAICGLPDKTDLLSNLILMGQWSLEKEQEIDGLQKDIQTIRRGLLDFIFNTTKLEKARSMLRRAERALIERLDKKYAILQNSAEAHAEVCQQRYLIGQITEKENGDRFWPKQNEFDDCSDNYLIIQLCEAFFQKSRISVTLIRELARSQQWRVYWEIAKNTNDLFDCSVMSWSLNQRELAYWSTIYDSVYSAFERPSKIIIEDDDLLDSWFIRQGEKIDSKTQKIMSPQSDKTGRNEEFIMADRDGAKRIYDMNNPGTRANIRARQKLLAKKGAIREEEMPDSQMEMRRQLMERQKKHIKNIGSR